MKTKQLTLIQNQTGGFTVISAQDTTEYLPGTSISSHLASVLCENSRWKIKIITGRQQ